MPVDWSLLWLGLRVAGLATLVSLPLAVGLGYALRDRRRAGGYASFALAFPPTIGCGFLLCAWWKRPFGWEFAAWAGVVYALPFLTNAARNAFLGVAPQYLAAARTLGASEWRACCVVALPLAWRPIAGAASLAFVRLLAEFAIVLLLERRL